MKKTIAIILTITMLALTLACSVPDNMNKETYDIAKKTLKIAQDYEDGKLDKNDAYVQLSALSYKIDRLPFGRDDYFLQKTALEVQACIWEIKSDIYSERGIDGYYIEYIKSLLNQ